MKNKTIDMFTDHYINDSFPVSLSNKEDYIEPYTGKKPLFGIKLYSPIERGYITILRKGQTYVDCKDDITDGEDAYLQGTHTYTNKSLNTSTKTRNKHIGTFIKKDKLVTLDLAEKRSIPPRPKVVTKGIRKDF